MRFRLHSYTQIDTILLMMFRRLILIAACPMLVWPGVSLKNSGIEVSIAVSNSQPPYIESIIQNSQTTSLMTDHLMELRCGAQLASGIWYIRDSSATQFSLHGDISDCGVGLQVDVRYHLQDSMLQMDSKIYTASHVEFPAGLSWHLSDSTDSISGYNHTQNPLIIRPDTTERYLHLDQFNTLYLAGQKLRLFQTNPFHSWIRLSPAPQRKSFLDVLPLLPANSLVSDSGSWSSLNPTDTLYQSLAIGANEFPERTVYMSEHPKGNEQEITMYFDELPNRDNWSPVRDTCDVKTPIYSQFVSLLDMFPKMKMGWLLMTDRMVIHPPAIIGSWTVSSAAILVDTIAPYQGKSQLYWLPLDSSISELHQHINTDSGIVWECLFAHKGPLTISLISADSSYRSERVIAGDSTWMIDSVSFDTTGASGTFRLAIRNQKNTSFFLDHVVLRKVGDSISVLTNADFESNTPGILFTSAQRSWTEAVGPEWIGYETKDYGDFLRGLDQVTDSTSWKFRVRLGSHGLHHSPTYNLPDPAHEFNWFNPFEDSLRLARIQKDLSGAGLSMRLMRFWRPPGFRHTRSLIHQLIPLGTVWLDPGWSYLVHPDRYFFLQRDGKMMWGNTTSWWMDARIGFKDWNLFPTAVWGGLKRGHLIHLGGHPEAMLPGDFRMLDTTTTFFRQIEQQYPHSIYVFPDEYADWATAVSKLHMQYQVGVDSVVSIQGNLPNGFTLVFQGNFSEDSVRSLFPATTQCVQTRVDSTSPQRIYAWIEPCAPPAFIKTRTLRSTKARTGITIDAKGRRNQGHSQTWKSLIKQ